jgi:signal transduction histidine kinase
VKIAESADTQERDADNSELAKLRQQMKELCLSVRARDDFIAIAAHELGNLMTPAIGVAELALVVAQGRRHLPSTGHRSAGAGFKTSFRIT